MKTETNNKVVAADGAPGDDKKVRVNMTFTVERSLVKKLASLSIESFTDDDLIELLGSKEFFLDFDKVELHDQKSTQQLKTGIVLLVIAKVLDKGKAK